MASCVKCGCKGAEYERYEGGYVCDDCIGNYFTCPNCGRVFDADDYEHGDAGTGFCVECERNRE